jgi:hypothetical protein
MMGKRYQMFLDVHNCTHDMKRIMYAAAAMVRTMALILVQVLQSLTDFLSSATTDTLILISSFKSGSILFSFKVTCSAKSKSSAKTTDQLP